MAVPVSGKKPSSNVAIPPPPPLAPAPPLPTGSHTENSFVGAAPDAVCPKCGGKLISPESLGLCEDCGYCRSLADETVLKKAAKDSAVELQKRSQRTLCRGCSPRSGCLCLASV